jgi:hypothetical protein
MAAPEPCAARLSLIQDWLGGYRAFIIIPDWVEGSTVKLKMQGISKVKMCDSGAKTYWGANDGAHLFFVVLDRPTGGAGEQRFSCTFDGVYQATGHSIEYHGERCYAAPPPPPQNFQPCTDLKWEWQPRSNNRGVIFPVDQDNENKLAFYEGRLVRASFQSAVQEEYSMKIEQIWNARYKTHEDTKTIDFVLEKPKPVLGVLTTPTFKYDIKGQYIVINVDARVFPYVVNPLLTCDVDWPPPVPALPAPSYPPYIERPHHPPLPGPPPPPPFPLPPSSPAPPTRPPFPPAHTINLAKLYQPPPPPNKHRHKHAKKLNQDKNDAVGVAALVHASFESGPYGSVAAWVLSALGIVACIVATGVANYMRDYRVTRGLQQVVPKPVQTVER